MGGKIDAEDKTIHKLLFGAKFYIDYYQREFRWGTKQVTELLDDLCGKFFENHKNGNERIAVKGYAHYFLGSIIVSFKDKQKFIVDGQQRLISLTLLLTHIHHLLRGNEQGSNLAALIYSEEYDKKSSNLNVEAREACMEAIFEGQDYDVDGQSESVTNIWNRYKDIKTHFLTYFPDKIVDDTLPYFSDWLTTNVHLVEITAYSRSDAYTIFETMNDRGLSLTPTDMLKGYLLNNIDNTEQQNCANTTWRSHVSALQELGKEEDAHAITSWLRSQHAQTIRERNKGAIPLDFDLIGTKFHRWVRSNEELLKLRNSSDFYQFIMDDFTFYAKWYKAIHEAVETLTPGLETIYYNVHFNFRLQYPVLLAPLIKTDSKEVIHRKLRIVASYLDILIARRLWNGKAISSMEYTMFQLVILKIRGKGTEVLIDTLVNRLREDSKNLAFNDKFGLTPSKRNRKQVRSLLARITDFVETGSGESSRFIEYVDYDIEHIWAAKPEQHKDEFENNEDFDKYRNRIGGLLLLPKSFNRSYGALPFEKKSQQYVKHNLLAASLNEKSYEHNPGFKRFRRDSGLLFKAHSEFKKADLDERQALYSAIAERIWNPENLLKQA